jgi:hypothetical protein
MTAFDRVVSAEKLWGSIFSFPITQHPVTHDRSQGLQDVMCGVVFLWRPTSKFGVRCSIFIFPVFILTRIGN